MKSQFYETDPCGESGNIPDVITVETVDEDIATEIEEVNS